MYAQTTLSRPNPAGRAEPRPYASAPARSSDAKGDLQLLFKSYDAACLDFDADAAAGFYDLPCLISTQEGNASFTARGEVRAAMARIFTGYRQRGLVSASLVSLNIALLATDFAQVQVIWSLANARGADIVSFAAAYTLRQAAGRWRIAHAMALDEAEKLAQRRPRAPILTLTSGR